MSNSIGKMRYRVKVERATNTRDAGGGISQAFNPVTFIYANIRPKSANSSYRQGMLQETLSLQAPQALTGKVWCKKR